MSPKESLSSAFTEITHQKPSPEGVEFLKQLETTIADDLWKSAGGHWSEDSVKNFKHQALTKLAVNLNIQRPIPQEAPAQAHEQTRAAYVQAWQTVVRDFHQNNYWGEQRLAKKEVKPKTEQQKIFWELFSYIWMLLQATLVTKTLVFYFGLKSAQEDSTEAKIYVILAIAFSFASLIFFAYRKGKKDIEK